MYNRLVLFFRRLDEALYRACKKDAHELCENPHLGDSDKDVSPQGMTLACLYRHILPNMNPDPEKKVCKVGNTLNTDASCMKWMLFLVQWLHLLGLHYC